MMKQRFGLSAMVLSMATGALVFAWGRPAVWPAAAVAFAEPPQEDDENTVGEISEDVAQVRFEKLGYTNIGPWTREDDYLLSTGNKSGKTWKLSIHVLTGAMQETEKPAPQ